MYKWYKDGVSDLRNQRGWRQPATASLLLLLHHLICAGADSSKFGPAVWLNLLAARLAATQPRNGQLRQHLAEQRLYVAESASVLSVFLRLSRACLDKMIGLI